MSAAEATTTNTHIQLQWLILYPIVSIADDIKNATLYLFEVVCFELIYRMNFLLSNKE